jgi:diguanylate cyclase (GGDEF)-like protein
MIKAHVTEKLSSTNLMKLYGKIRFSWDLEKDSVHWHGPIDKILDLDFPLNTGTSFLNRLSPDQFWKRLKDISNRQGASYICHYMLLLNNLESCLIEERGELTYNSQGIPILVTGEIQAIATSKDDLRHNPSGYDGLTGFPQKEVLLENLVSLLDTPHKTTPPTGGYLCFSIDYLSCLSFTLDLETLQKLIQQVGKKLRSSSRFNDVIGRVSGCCFGVVLKDTDEWGVFQSADRLRQACQSIVIQTPSGPFKPTLSFGGSTFDSEVPPLSIMKQAERNLYDMQAIKSAGVLEEKPRQNLIPFPRPKKKQKGKHRLTD